MPKDGPISPQRNDPRPAPEACDAPGAQAVRVNGLDGPDQLAPLRLTVLAALQLPDGLELELDCADGLEAAAAQFLCATHKAASALGRSVRFRGLDAPRARAGLALLGLRAAPDCALLPCPLCAGEDIP